MDEDERLKRIRDVIQFHFDLEILHKQYEERFLNSEIERRRQLLVELKQLIYYEYLLQAGLKESSNSGILEGSSGKDWTEDLQHGASNSQNNTPQKTLRGNISLEQTYQFERRSDGVIVKYIID